MSVICKLIDSFGRKFSLKKCAMNAWKYFSHSDSKKKLVFFNYICTVWKASVMVIKFITGLTGTRRINCLNFKPLDTI